MPESEPESTRKGTAIVLAFLALFAFGLTARIWEPGLLFGHSAWLDACRAVVFHAHIRQGILHPEWMSHFYFGHGSPLFHFYAPVSYYFIEFFVLCGISIPTALKAALIGGFVLSGWTMFLAARDYFSRAASLFAALLYLGAPYRFVDLFVRHAMAEHLAFIWFPLLFWGLNTGAADFARRRAAALVFGTAGIILTHNVMALIGLPFVYLLAQFVHGGSRRSFFARSAGAAWGIAISLFFWYPCLADKHLVFADESLTEGYQSYGEHFLNASQLFAGPSADDKPGTQGFQIGWVHLGCAALAVAALFLRAGKTMNRRAILFSLGAAAAACVATVPISSPFWRIAPGLKFVQFPWRFLGLVGFAISFAGAGWIEPAGRLFGRRWANALAGMVALVIFMIDWPMAEPSFLIADRSTGIKTVVTSAEREERLKSGQAYPAEEFLTEKVMVETNQTGTSRDDYLPRVVLKQPEGPENQAVQTLAGTLRDIRRKNFYEITAEADLAEPGAVRLGQFYFPGWNGYVDGVAVPTGAVEPSGLVSIEVPAGRHAVAFRFEGTGLGHLLSAISAAAAVLFLPLLFRKPRLDHASQGVSRPAQS